MPASCDEPRPHEPPRTTAAAAASCPGCGAPLDPRAGASSACGDCTALDLLLLG